MEYKKKEELKNTFMFKMVKNDPFENSFLEMFEKSNEFWKNGEYETLKIILENLINCFSDQSYFSFFQSISFDRLSLDLLKTFFEIISTIIENEEFLHNFYVILNYYLILFRLTLSKSNFPTKSKYNEFPLLPFCHLLQNEIVDIVNNSVMIINYIMRNFMLDEQDTVLIINFLLDKITIYKNDQTHFVKNMLHLLSTWCENVNKKIIGLYVSKILSLANDLFESDNSYYYIKMCIHIAVYIQQYEFNVYNLNHDLFSKIINVINDFKLQNAYHDAYNFMIQSLYYYGSMVINEITKNVNRIFQLFLALSFEQNRDKDPFIIDLVSSILYEDPGTIGLLLIQNSIEAIIKYLKHANYKIREPTLFLVWNVLYFGTTDQITYLLKNDIIFENIIESLDQNDIEFQKLASKTIKRIIDIFGYKKTGDSKFIDILIEKINSVINSSLDDEYYELVQIFPDFFVANEANC